MRLRSSTRRRDPPRPAGVHSPGGPFHRTGSPFRRRIVPPPQLPATLCPLPLIIIRDGLIRTMTQQRGQKKDRWLDLAVITMVSTRLDGWDGLWAMDPPDGGGLQTNFTATFHCSQFHPTASGGQFSGGASVVRHPSVVGSAPPISVETREARLCLCWRWRYLMVMAKSAAQSPGKPLRMPLCERLCISTGFAGYRRKRLGSRRASDLLFCRRLPIYGCRPSSH